MVRLAVSSYLASRLARLPDSVNARGVQVSTDIGAIIGRQQDAPCLGLQHLQDVPLRKSTDHRPSNGKVMRDGMSAAGTQPDAGIWALQRIGNSIWPPR